MSEIRNLNDKRVFDQSEDLRIVEIQRGNFVTRITASPDGTLNIQHEYIPLAT